MPSVRCSVADGQREKFLVHLNIHYNDGRSEWIDPAGNIESVDSFDETSQSNQRIALRSFVTKQAGDEMLSKAVDHFTDTLERNCRAKMFAVAASIERARAYGRRLQAKGINALVAVSEDRESNENIKRFKRDPNVKILVGVGKIHEGVNCKQATHLCYLTPIRTIPHAVQVIGRVLRFDDHVSAVPYEQQIAHVFVAKDPMFIDLIERIKAEGAYVATSEANDNDELQSQRSGPRSDSRRALSSRLIGSTVYDFATGLPASAHAVQRALSEAGIPLTDQQLEALHEPPDNDAPDGVTIVTAKERRQRLRSLIEQTVRQLASKIDRTPEQLNSDLKSLFGKGRAEMNEDELRTVYQRVCEASREHGIDIGDLQ
jgi:hypothetical protein